MERHPLTRDEFRGLLRTSRRAFHLELKDTYNVTSESDPFRKWMDGEPDDFAWRESWLGFIAEVTKSGVAVQRVRVVSEPHTDYTRWGIDLAPQGLSAGEDIRYLPRRLVSAEDLPPEDFWMLDDDTLILSLFAEDGTSAGFARSFDAEEVGRYRRARDLALSLAVPFDTYVG